MPDFNTLYTEYEHTRNVCRFCKDFAANSAATRFLLIRSLDRKNLKDIIASYSDELPEGSIKALTEKAYYSAVTIPQLIDYIESKRPELVRQREAELKGLSELLTEFPIVNCGIRNDKVDDIVKTFVRNKSLKTMDALTRELDTVMLPRIRQYSLWSYYNQTSNDIIELFFLKHPAVIPTLRKIHDIDFFLKINNDIIPFDLKYTHISDSYFDFISQGILKIRNSELHDDFYIHEKCQTNEFQYIKSYYTHFKREHRDLRLPNLRGLEKSDLLDILVSTGNLDAVQFVMEATKRHTNYIPTTHEELHPLEWWNYKYQGERLFCNNNRLFVFLAYTDKFMDGRALKGKTKEIGQKITELLDHLTAKDIHTVHYHYDKEESLTGDYTALSLSTIYYE